MDVLHEHLIGPVSEFLWNYVLLYLLTGAGIYFTVRTRGVQFRLFSRAVRALRHSGATEKGGISSFQAFAVGIASRVGTGNIAGVAIALTLGGPGAIFWMWCLGLLGMATGFIEATLAQIFKVRAPDGSFRGGPATYIQRGLGSRRWGVIFALLLIVTFGVAFVMVQTNTIADVVGGAHTLSKGWIAIILMVITAPVLLGGVKRVARVSAVVVPIMAVTYIGLALFIVLMNISDVPRVLSDIVRSAFGADQALAGTAGGLTAALLNGAKRGLFSNEAGMGSAPNAAATASTAHPVNQGLIQTLGVFVDTILVCSATAFMILTAGPAVYRPGVTGDAAGASLTQVAIADHLGSWTKWPVTIMVIVFAYSSVLGNYSYAEVNLYFLRASAGVTAAFRAVVVGAVGLGSIVALATVWALADVTMALMALVNLVAIVLLGKWAFGALRDWESQHGGPPVFRPVGNPHLPETLETDAWESLPDPALARR